MAAPLAQSSPRPLGQRGPRSEMLLALKRAGQLTAKELASASRAVAQRGAAPPQGTRARAAGGVRAAASRGGCAGVRLPALGGERVALSAPLRGDADPAAGPGGGCARVARVRWRCSKAGSRRLPRACARRWWASRPSTGWRSSRARWRTRATWRSGRRRAGMGRRSRSTTAPSRRWRSGTRRSASPSGGSSRRCCRPR